jgi:hypothetical protein
VFGLDTSLIHNLLKNLFLKYLLTHTYIDVINSITKMKRALSLPKNLGQATLKFVNNKAINDIYLSGNVAKWAHVLYMKS